MSMSYHMRVYALQRKSTAFNLISIYLVAQGSDRMLQFKKISLICNNWRSLHVKHTFIMMKLYDYFPRWRVELKWWRIVALRTFIGCRSVHGSGARRACLLPAACAAHPAFHPLVGFLEIRGGVFVVSAAAGQGGSLLRRVEDVDLLLNWWNARFIGENLTIAFSQKVQNLPCKPNNPAITH